MSVTGQTAFYAKCNQKWVLKSEFNFFTFLTRNPEGRISNTDTHTRYMNSVYSQPMSMTQMEKIFSGLVLGETLPKPTLVKLLKVKYRAVTYLSLMLGPDKASLSL